MSMLKKEKIEFVKELKEEIKKYKTVGVMPIDALPDRLLQKIRNTERENTKIVFARKTLLLKALEGNSEISKLSEFVTKNSVIILSNKDPMALYNSISSNKLKLAAKPNQIANNDIVIEAGETSIPPGQGVTDLKTAGIDVQIQKGKVVISKSKVLVQKGVKIPVAVSKALKMLDIMPFEAVPKLSCAVYENLFFSNEVLNINTESVKADLSMAFLQAYNITLETGYVTEYNVDVLLRKAYLSAIGLGIAANIYEPGVVETLIAKAIAEAINIKLQGNIE
ncbi:MAG: 50S ribosomal protein L10 [Candidatus Micrarchaeia archaeon]